MRHHHSSVPGASWFSGHYGKMAKSVRDGLLGGLYVTGACSQRGLWGPNPNPFPLLISLTLCYSVRKLIPPGNCFTHIMG